jgi:hypothetical protein
LDVKNPRKDDPYWNIAASSKIQNKIHALWFVFSDMQNYPSTPDLIFFEQWKIKKRFLFFYIQFNPCEYSSALREEKSNT